MIAIVDYGSGNIQAVKNIYDKLNIVSFFARTAEDLERADKIILPGVGAFDQAMGQLNESGMKAKLDELVLIKKVPILGVCVGMQIMANSSEEGRLAGLGWFDAMVKIFDVSKLNIKPKLPHMGWNSVTVNKDHSILKGVDLETGFYFLHSYFVKCENVDEVLFTSFYGAEFHCAINKNNIFGFQFHPEKSHHNGINLFKNFAGL